MAKEKFLKKCYFSMKRIVVSTLESLDKYRFRNMGENSVSAKQHIESRKVLLKYFSPNARINYFAYSCISTFHTLYKNGIIGHMGECCNNDQKQLIIKTY